MTPRQKISWVVGTAVATLTLVSLSIALWPKVGWKTPDGHDISIVAVEQTHDAVNTAILTQLGAISAQVTSNRDEWWCDEEDETLDDYISQKDAGDESAALEQEILEQREKMSDVSCHRFDND